MTKQATICVGTLGQGIWRSSDGGDTWLRVRHGIYSESAVRALAVHPSDARIMYCGADSGIYRSEDKGEHWEHLDSPMNETPRLGPRHRPCRPQYHLRRHQTFSAVSF